MYVSFYIGICEFLFAGVVMHLITIVCTKEWLRNKDNHRLKGIDTELRLNTYSLAIIDDIRPHALKILLFIRF